MIDTHCHLTFEGIAERRDEVLGDARAAGVERMVTIGSTPGDAEDAAELAKSIDGVYATAGLHPHYADRMTDAETLRASLGHMISRYQSHIVALGEMGLDWHYADPAPEIQRHAFAAQLELLDQHRKLPAVIHNREATEDTLAMIRQAGVPGERFVFHCFTGNANEVDQILEIGAMVGLTGIVTFKNARDLAEASDRIPLDRLLVETDSPFCTPEPHRKVRPNEPRYVIHVAQFLADRRGMSLDRFTQAVDANARRFFTLPDELSIENSASV